MAEPSWHGTEAAETKTRKHPMFKTEQIWKPLKTGNICENTWKQQYHWRLLDHFGSTCPVSVSLDIGLKNAFLQTCSLPKPPGMFAVVPCLFAYTGAQIKTMRYLETIVAGQLQALRTEYLEPWRPPAFWNRLGQLCLAEIQVVSVAMLAIGISHVSIKPTNLAIFYSVHT
jgi:hypothetical protein